MPFNLKSWRQKNSAKLKEKRSSPVAKERLRLSSQEARRLDRAIVIDYYSGGTDSCKCCGETEPTFLAIDHIKGGGLKHLKKIGRAYLVSWLLKKNLPPGFQILCHNCNMAKSQLGRCPHKNK